MPLMALLSTAMMTGCGGGGKSDYGIPIATSPANGLSGSTGGVVASSVSSLAASTGRLGAPLGPPAITPSLAAQLLSQYALTTSAGLTATQGTASGFANSAIFGGDVVMDAPFSTCTSIPASANASQAIVVVGTAQLDSCGLEVGLIDTINPPVNIPNGLKITGLTMRYFATNSTAFNDKVRAVKTALNTVWIDAFQQAGATLILGPGTLGGLHLTPGIYKSASTMVLGSGETLVLDAYDNPNGVWLFQVGSSLTITGSTAACTNLPVVCTPTQIVLLNGAQARNVFWQIGTPRLAAGAPLGGDVSFTAATGPSQNNTIFAGTILAGNSITFAGGATVTGRILAGADLLGTTNTQTGGTVTTSSGSTGAVIVTLP